MAQRPRFVIIQAGVVVGIAWTHSEAWALALRLWPCELVPAAVWQEERRAA